MQGSRLLPHYKPRQGSGGWEKEVVGESPGLAGGCGLRANASHPVGATAIESPSNGDAKASQSSQRLPAKRLPAEKLSATKRPFCRPLPAAAASAMSCNMSRCRSAQVDMCGLLMAAQSVESVSRSCTVPRLKTLSSLPSKKTPCIRPPA